ncbi:hypothetical protein OAF25_01265 [Akkermansiaceae bacterium]|nr:hypothetical protein [Akkermansiaceae bacterium]
MTQDHHFDQIEGFKSASPELSGAAAGKMRLFKKHKPSLPNPLTQGMPRHSRSRF